MDRINYDDLVIVCKAKSKEIEQLKKELNEAIKMDDSFDKGFMRGREESVKEIEQYKHTLEHHVKEIKLLTAEIDKKDEKHERLEKEKKWILDEAISIYCPKSIRQSEKTRLIKKMQQALKKK